MEFAFRVLHGSSIIIDTSNYKYTSIVIRALLPHSLPYSKLGNMVLWILKIQDPYRKSELVQYFKNLNAIFQRQWEVFQNVSIMYHNSWNTDVKTSSNPKYSFQITSCTDTFKENKTFTVYYKKMIINQISSRKK